MNSRLLLLFSVCSKLNFNHSNLMNFKQLGPFIFFLLFSSAIHAQPPWMKINIRLNTDKLQKNIKRVIQLEGDQIMNIIEYDTLPNEIFNHHKQYVGEFWNGKYITMISARIFNKQGQVIKSYSGHSNAGLTILYYTHDSINNKITSYSKSIYNLPESNLVNKNPYRFLAETEILPAEVW